MFNFVPIGPKFGSNLTPLSPCVPSIDAYIRDGRFGSKVGQIGPKWDKSWTFSDQISVHLAHRARNIRLEIGLSSKQNVLKNMI